MQNESWQKSLGGQLKAGREKEGMTQDQVAELLGLKGKYRRETIRLYEAGRRIPSVENLKKMLSRFDVTVDLGWCLLSPSELPTVLERSTAHQIPFEFAQDVVYKGIRVRMTATQDRFQVLTQLPLKAS
jgi:transcriptional regulator with XRE-family HTH domain